jgi:hypothetical protein
MKKLKNEPYLEVAHFLNIIIIIIIIIIIGKIALFQP